MKWLFIFLLNDLLGYQRGFYAVCRLSVACFFIIFINYNYGIKQLIAQKAHACNSLKWFSNDADALWPALWYFGPFQLLLIDQNTFYCPRLRITEHTFM